MSIDVYENNVRKFFHGTHPFIFTEYALSLLRADFDEAQISSRIIGRGSKKDRLREMGQNRKIFTTINNAIELFTRGFDVALGSKEDALVVYEIIETHFVILPKILKEELWGREVSFESHKKIAAFGDYLWTRYIFQMRINGAYAKARDLEKEYADKNKLVKLSGSTPVFQRKNDDKEKEIGKLDFEILRTTFSDEIRSIEAELRQRRKEFGL